MEASFTGLMNTKIHTKDKDFNDPNFDRNVSFYSGNLDLRFMLINSELLATGPALGAQLSKFTRKEYLTDEVVDDGTAWGFNIGWHVRFTVAENIKINGGWRYTNAAEDQSHHIIYLGVGYAFSLF
ncbi:MAG: porin family protein [Bacteroidales bacterium]|nr:porin family protein [Bacteroidales bacterium]